MRSDLVDARVRSVWLALVWGIGLSPLGFAFLYPRVWRSTDSFETENLLLPLETAVLLRQVLLVVVLLLAGWAVWEALRHRRREGFRGARAGMGLWIAALAFCAATLLSAVWGAAPRLRVGLVIVPALLTAVFLLPPVPLRWFTRQLRAVLLVYAYGSLLVALLLPGWALQYGFPGAWFDAFSFRLHGLQSHANILAPVLVTYLVLDWLDFRRGPGVWLHRGVVLVCLVLTQSRTAAVLLVLLFGLRFVLVRSHRYTPVLRGGIGVLALLAVAAPLLVVGPAWSRIGAPAAAAGAAGVADSAPAAVEQHAQAVLTGRPRMWRETLEVWRQHPWLGYGPELFQGDRIPRLMGQTERRRIHVPHAHSQLVQALGQSGLIGASCLLLYLAAMLVYGLRGFDATRGVSLLLVLALFGRSVTEVPLQLFAGDSTLLLHVATFAFLLLAARRAGEGSPRGPGTEVDGTGYRLEPGLSRSQRTPPTDMPAT